MKAILLALAMLSASWPVVAGELTIYNESGYTLYAAADASDINATFVAPYPETTIKLTPEWATFSVIDTRSWWTIASASIDYTHNWQLWVHSDMSAQLFDLGAPVLRGYSLNILGSALIDINETERYFGTPFAGFDGNSAILSTYGIQPGMEIQDSLGGVFTYDGYTTWYDDAGNEGIPYVVPGSPVYLYNIPPPLSLLVQGDVTPGPGQSASLFVPDGGVFSSIYPLDNYPLDLPLVEGARVYSLDAAGTPYAYSGYECSNGQWVKFTDSGGPVPMEAFGGALQWSDPSADLNWTQTSPEPARSGDIQLRASGPDVFLMGSWYSGNDYVLLWKAHITDTNWTYSSTFPAEGDGHLYFGDWDTWVNMPTGFFQAVDVAVDNDGDGIPDWWEVSNNGNPGDASDASADPDHDGISNYEAYQQRVTAASAAVRLVTYNISR